MTKGDSSLAKLLSKLRGNALVLYGSDEGSEFDEGSCELAEDAVGEGKSVTSNGRGRHDAGCVRTGSSKAGQRLVS